MNGMNGKMMSVKDIATSLGCGKNKAYDIVKQKGFPKIKIGKQYYTPENEFNRWINNNLRREILL